MLQTNPSTKLLAERLISARRSQKLVDATDCIPLAAADAYAVQAIVADALGPVGAFKTSRKPGSEQTLAPIFAADIGWGSGMFSALPGDVLAVELELGFRLMADPPALGDPDFVERLRSILEPVAALEIVGSRISGITAQDALAKLADNQNGAGLVVAEALPAGTARDSAAENDNAGSSLRAHLRVGDDVVLDGPAIVPGGDGFTTVCEMARRLGSHCGGLRKGQVVITGSLHPMVPVLSGTEIYGRLDGFGEVRALIS
ncbi:MAG: hypothetical protein JJU21_13295 [Salinarimonas sp.]|nr:hypothetical protein [Salinarimonas sp.]